MRDAPLYRDVADGPEGGRAWWLEAPDGVRLRLGHWPAGEARGTVLLMPGRTEYIEKYGRAARDLAALGYGTLTIDWRGQGLSDRIQHDPMSGHVLRFTDYQHDVDVMLAHAAALDLPRPWHMLGHSMGGTIGLRAAMRDLPFASCAFSAPMWGIAMTAILRPLAWALSWISRYLGLGHVYAPGGTRHSYILTEPFETNLLTRDREMHAYMVAQLRAHPELSLGGPSLHWLFEALRECRRLAAMPSPDLPCLTFIGSEEKIVSLSAIEARIQRWPDAQLERVEGARHEFLMETPATRAHVMRLLGTFWQRHAGRGGVSRRAAPPAAGCRGR
jgi:lysophospholipase